MISRRMFLQAMLAAPVERTGRVYSFIWNNPLLAEPRVAIGDVDDLLKGWYSLDYIERLILRASPFLDVLKGDK